MRFSAILCLLLCLVSTIYAESVVNDKEYAFVVTKDNFEKSVLESGKDVFIEFYAPWCGHCKNLAPTYEDLAKKMSDEDVIVAKFDAQAHEIPSLFDVRGYPTLFWLSKNAKDSPVPYKGGRSVEEFVKFIAKHSTDGLKNFDMNGKKISEDEPAVNVEPAINENSSASGEADTDKSDKTEKIESIPEEPQLVKEVVAGNFKEFVLDAGVDVLIQFYAPWCGHCRKFAPEYEKLALKLADEDILLVKFDATANKLDPLFDVNSVPTIFFLPKNAKQAPVIYEGDRQPEDLIMFVAEHSTDGLKQFCRDGTIKTDEPAEKENSGQEKIFDDEL